MSRDVGDIRGCAHISLDELQKEVNQDIKRVVSFTFDNMDSTVLDEDSKTRLMDRVLDGAGGTFLWAGCIAHELAERKTKREIVNLMQTLPKDLNALYDRMLREIPQKDQQMCANILRWVVLALEPLKLADLCEALEIKRTQETTALEELEFWIKRCGHILQVSGTKISLIHQSAKDYLLASHPRDANLTIFRVSTVEGHCEIASRCIGYLEKSKMRNHIITKWRSFDDKSRCALTNDRAHCAFFSYALDHWVQHVQFSSTKFSTVEREYPNFFNFTSGTCLRSIAFRGGRVGIHVPDDKYPMRIAIREGILEWAKSIHARRNLKDLRHPFYHMKWKKEAMTDAISEGYMDIVAWLLDIGYDSNSTVEQSNFGIKRLPLVLYAFTWEKYDIMDLLVRRGALIYGKPMHPESLKSLECQGCDIPEAWFRILLDGFVKHPKGSGVTAAYDWIFHCIWKDKVSLVRQLLTVDWIFPSRYLDDHPSCILEQALMEHTVDDSVNDIWEYLIQQVIDQDREYRLLNGAAGHGHGSRGCQASELAVQAGNGTALKTLLSHDCFITTIQEEPWTWSIAWENHSSHPDIIPMLIENGAATEATLDTALEDQEYYAVVELLLSKGFDPNVDRVRGSTMKPRPDWYGDRMTPLAFAERIQDDALITLLQRFGAKRSSAHS